MKAWGNYVKKEESGMAQQPQQRPQKGQEERSSWTKTNPPGEPPRRRMPNPQPEITEPTDPVPPAKQPRRHEGAP